MTDAADPHPDPGLPASFGAAVARGALGRCPRCGEAPLFARFIRPVAHCPECGQDWRFQRADDLPAYLSILITGHLLAPVIILLIAEYDMGPGLAAAIILPLAVIMLIALLQPAKGAVIALQWWHGMHGFVRERRQPAAPPAAG